MTITTTPRRWRSPARMSVCGPTGWAPAERIEVHHRDGDALVTVTSWPVERTADLDKLADAHAAQLLGRGAEGTSLVPTTVLGQDGRSIHGNCAHVDGRTLSMSLGYTLRHGRMFAVTQVAPEGDDAKAAEMADIVRSLSVTAPSEIEESSLPTRPSSPSGVVAAARAWSTGGPQPRPVEHVLTTEEAFGAARHHGVAMLPGTGGPDWDLMDQAGRDLASAVAWRSLVARGAAEDTPLAEAIAVAAGHDVLLVVTEHGADGPRTRWYAARPDLSVRIRPGARPATVTLAVVDTTALADLVLADRVEPTATITASCVHRHDGRVTGEETTWGPDLLETDVRRELARLLPADDSDRRQ